MGILMVLFLTYDKIGVFSVIFAYYIGLTYGFIIHIHNKLK